MQHQKFCGPCLPTMLLMFGLVVGALPAITVFVVGSAMTDMVVVGILMMQAVWNIAAATLLLLIEKQDKQNLRALSA